MQLGSGRRLLRRLPGRRCEQPRSVTWLPLSCGWRAIVSVARPQGAGGEGEEAGGEGAGGAHLGFLGAQEDEEKEEEEEDS